MSPQKRERELAKKFNCTVTKTRGGHYQLLLPCGAIVTTASTPSDWRDYQQIRKHIRRAMRERQQQLENRA
jgi:hypothetical protein